MDTRESWAWAAGIFDGEGCIRFQGDRTVSLIVGMTDEDVVRRLHAVMGCGKVYSRQPRQAHYKRRYEWVVSASADVRRVLEGLLPWLGTRRSARAHAALERLVVPPWGGRPRYAEGEWLDIVRWENALPET